MRNYQALKLIERGKRGRTILVQVVFWSLSYIVLYKLFTADYSGGLSDIIYTLLFHIPLSIVVYVNWWMLGEYGTRPFWVSAIGFILCAFLGTAIHFLLFEMGSDFLAPGFYFISYYSVWQIFQFSISYLIISTLLIWSYNWFDLQGKQAAILKENQAVKLEALKAQVNPHFLINSLNNIYSLSGDHKEETRDYLIKLSDALRYMVYETEAEHVLLEKELRYLRDYMALEELRLEDNANIVLTEVGSFQGYMIAPLLLVPLVENCFKHCDRSRPEIAISFEETDTGFALKTRNNWESSKREGPGGVGLENVRKRLELIYPNKYDLATRSIGGYFTVELKLDLS